jgi:hypothetical protein
VTVYLVRKVGTQEYFGRNWSGSYVAAASAYGSKATGAQKRNRLNRTDKANQYELVEFKLVETGVVS